jgi:transcriptional regulator with XRE-family HTH domain
MSEHTSSKSAVAEFLTTRLAASDKTQRQISVECGFETPNIITMLKNGSTKIPLNRVGALASAIDVDPAYLLRLVLTEYMPDTWQCIEEFTKAALLTANELDLVCKYRAATFGTDPKPVSLMPSRSKVFTMLTA